MKPQNKLIFNYMKTGKSITALDALNKFGCFRLARVIGDLKADGYKIDREMVGKAKRFACYSLKK